MEITECSEVDFDEFIKDKFMKESGDKLLEATPLESAGGSEATTVFTTRQIPVPVERLKNETNENWLTKQASNSKTIA